jgi:hypothetical protein
MNLELKSTSGFFLNSVAEIKSIVPSLGDNDFFSFGQLLAYCYYFGIQDLHKDNILWSQDGLQVIDAEQAFSELLLPNQTLMLPANREIIWSAALNLLKKSSLEHLSRSQARSLLDGFFELSILFIENISEITEILRQNIRDIKQQPIRIFFRGTREYVEALTRESIRGNFFDEETIQLSRGDVPYFFKFMGNESVFYYSSIDWEITKVKVPDGFQKFVSYCAKDPADLITEINVKQQWARGMLYLVKKLSALNSEDTHWPSCSIEKVDGQLEFTSPDLKMIAKTSNSSS